MASSISLPIFSAALSIFSPAFSAGPFFLHAANPKANVAAINTYVVFLGASQTPL